MAPYEACLLGYRGSFSVGWKVQRHGGRLIFGRAKLAACQEGGVNLILGRGKEMVGTIEGG
jgi:hypothetical protein